MNNDLRTRPITPCGKTDAANSKLIKSGKGVAWAAGTATSSAFVKGFHTTIFKI